MGGTPVLARGLAGHRKVRERAHRRSRHSRAALIDKEPTPNAQPPSLTFPKSLPACACRSFRHVSPRQFQRPPQLVEVNKRGRRQSQRPRQHPPRSPQSIASGKQSIEIEGDTPPYTPTSPCRPSTSISMTTLPPRLRQITQPTADNSRRRSVLSKPQQPSKPSFPFDRFQHRPRENKKRQAHCRRYQAHSRRQDESGTKFREDTIDSVGTGWFKLTPPKTSHPANMHHRDERKRRHELFGLGPSP